MTIDLTFSLPALKTMHEQVQLLTEPQRIATRLALQNIMLSKPFNSPEPLKNQFELLYQALHDEDASLQKLIELTSDVKKILDALPHRIEEKPLSCHSFEIG
jgi:hypothetical protein